MCGPVPAPHICPPAHNGAVFREPARPPDAVLRSQHRPRRRGLVRTGRAALPGPPCPAPRPSLCQAGYGRVAPIPHGGQSWGERGAGMSRGRGPGDHRPRANSPKEAAGAARGSAPVCSGMRPPWPPTSPARPPPRWCSGSGLGAPPPPEQVAGVTPLRGAPRCWGGSRLEGGAGSEDRPGSARCWGERPSSFVDAGALAVPQGCCQSHLEHLVKAAIGQSPLLWTASLPAP